MFGDILNTILWIVGSIAIVVLLYLWLNARKQDEDKEDLPFVLNFLASESGGRAFGLEEEAILTLDKKNWIISFIPKDLTNLEAQDPKCQKPVKLIVEKNKRAVISRGSLSKSKNGAVYFPRSSMDFPEEFKETPIGKLFVLSTELLNADETVLRAFEERLNRQSMRIKETAMGEASKAQIQVLEEHFKQALNSILTAKKEKSSSSSPIEEK